MSTRFSLVSTPPFSLGQPPPLLPHLLVVPAQPVDALHAEQVAGAEPPHQPLILRAVKVLARLLVHVDVVSVQPRLAHGDDLPGLVLFRAGYPDVAVLCCHSSLAAFPLIDGNGITKADKTIPPAAISGEMRGYFHIIGNHPAPTVPMALTHTVTHTTKRVDGNSGEDRTYLPQYTERKASKSLKKQQAECPDTLRNQ